MRRLSPLLWVLFTEDERQFLETLLRALVGAGVSATQ